MIQEEKKRKGSWQGVTCGEMKMIWLWRKDVPASDGVMFFAKLNVVPPSDILRFLNDIGWSKSFVILINNGTLLYYDYIHNVTSITISIGVMTNQVAVMLCSGGTLHAHICLCYLHYRML